MKIENEKIKSSSEAETTTEIDECRIKVEESRKRMKILMVEPTQEPTYWSYHYALPYLNRQAAYSPHGLITLGGMLPKEWDLKLVDLKIRPIEQAELENSDAVFFTGMHVQAESFHKEVKRAKEAGKITVGGGPYVTSSPEECQDLDHLVIGEVEDGIHEWARLFEQGRAPHVATMHEMKRGKYPNIENVPLPRYDLLDMDKYLAMSLQFSRGCPQNCEFCSVTKLNGRVPRIKTTEQFLNEAEALYQTGFAGHVFVMDDNFIGNHERVMEMLPKLAEWQKERGYPFDLFTQADLRLAKMDDLMAHMVDAGFGGVFLGIETPSAEALKEANKTPNIKAGDLDIAVRNIAKARLDPMSGFIIGFDSDKDEKALDELSNFINRNPIPQAMLGVLQAVPQTDLYDRIKKEGRLRTDFQGDHFGTPNFKTVMDIRLLRSKYGEILKDIYNPKNYFQRCLQLLQMRNNPRHSIVKKRLRFGLMAFKNSLLRQGLTSDYRGEYWRFLAKVIMTMPKKLPTAVTQVIKFDHYYRFTHENVMPRLSAT